MGNLKKLVDDLKKNLAEDITQPTNVVGQEVDATLANGPEQNYEGPGRKKWEPFKQGPEGSDYVEGPGQFEGARGDVEQALAGLAKQLETEKPDPETAKKLIKTTVDGLKIPPHMKSKILVSFQKNETTPDMVKHLWNLILSFSGNKTVAETLKALKSIVAEGPGDLNRLSGLMTDLDKLYNGLKKWVQAGEMAEALDAARVLSMLGKDLEKEIQKAMKEVG